MVEYLRGSQSLWVAMGISLASHASAIVWLQGAPGDSIAGRFGNVAGHEKVLQVRLQKRDLIAFGPGQTKRLLFADSHLMLSTSAAGSGGGLSGSSANDAGDTTPSWRRAKLPVPEVKYLDAASVDQLARPIDFVMLSAPAEVGAGKVILVLLVSSDGQVDGASVEFSDLPDSFVEAALHAFRETRFIPAQQAGKPVPMRYRIEASFGYSVLIDEREISLPAPSADASEKQ